MANRDPETAANLHAQDAAEQRLDALHDDLTALEVLASDGSDWPPTAEHMLDLVDRLSCYAGTPSAIDDLDQLYTVIWALEANLRAARRS